MPLGYPMEGPAHQFIFCLSQLDLPQPQALFVANPAGAEIQPGVFFIQRALNERH